MQALITTMNTFQEEEIDDNLKDFITNFKFPWESEDDNIEDDDNKSSKTEVTRFVQRSSRHLYLSDTTPARKGKRLSGKNLTKEYSVAVSHLASPEAADCVIVAQSVGGTDSTESNDLSTEVNDVTIHKSCPETQHQAENYIQSNQLVRDNCSISSDKEENDYFPPTKKKKRKSSYFKRRESLALLKSIGEVSSPCKDKLQHDPPKPQESKKQQAKTSRRRSTRLSGISCPMLELGTNGVPKLVKRFHQSSLFQSPEPMVSNSFKEYSTPVLLETQAMKLAEADKDETFTSNEQELAYRHKNGSQASPLQSPRLVAKDNMGSQYHTPLNYEVPKVELCSPEQSVLSSLSSLHLQAQYSSNGIKDQKLSSFSGLEIPAKSCEDVIPYNLISSEENTLEESKGTMTPEKGDEKLWEESGSGILMERDLNKKNEIEMDISEWKENFDDSTSSIAYSCPTSPGSSFDETEVDPKVKEIYLKKGQLKPFKRTNTNLETVFEEQRINVNSFGKRKYRRSIAFPEKPWVPRNSKRGAKKQKGCKKKRLSLSKTSKNNDTALGERLNNILDSLVEEC